MKEFTVEQISRHNLQGGFGWKYTTFGRFYEVLDDLWIVINGKVYDVSTFDCHPGGKDILIRLAGQDASKEFEDQGHSATAIQEMKKFFIGVVKDEDEEIIDTTSSKTKKKNELINSAVNFIPTKNFIYHSNKIDTMMTIHELSFNRIGYEEVEFRDIYDMLDDKNRSNKHSRNDRKGSQHKEHKSPNDQKSNTEMQSEEEESSIATYLFFGGAAAILGYATIRFLLADE